MLFSISSELICIFSFSLSFFYLFIPFFFSLLFLSNQPIVELRNGLRTRTLGRSPQCHLYQCHVQCQLCRYSYCQSYPVSFRGKEKGKRREEWRGGGGEGYRKEKEGRERERGGVGEKKALAILLNVAFINATCSVNCGRGEGVKEKREIEDREGKRKEKGREREEGKKR